VAFLSPICANPNFVLQDRSKPKQPRQFGICASKAKRTALCRSSNSKLLLWPIPLAMSLAVRGRRQMEASNPLSVSPWSASPAAIAITKPLHQRSRCRSAKTAESRGVLPATDPQSSDQPEIRARQRGSGNIGACWARWHRGATARESPSPGLLFDRPSHPQRHTGSRSLPKGWRAEAAACPGRGMPSMFGFYGDASRLRAELTKESRNRPGVEHGMFGLEGQPPCGSSRSHVRVMIARHRHVQSGLALSASATSSHGASHGHGATTDRGSP
jgi:hypothetical protein